MRVRRNTEPQTLRMTIMYAAAVKLINTSEDDGKRAWGSEPLCAVQSILIDI
jgi:hypothetical protein